MEEWGSGYKRVANACREGGHPDPVWKELGQAIRVVFYPHLEVSDETLSNVPAGENVPENVPESENVLENVPENVPISANDPVNVPESVPVNNRQKWFLGRLASAEKCRAKDLAKRWKVSEKAARRDIADLKSKGVIAFSGSSRNGFYHIVQASRENDERHE